jgi:3-hydroxybutyryl-CoA dehydrogenase
MQEYEFSTAAVIGTGMMGPGIAVTLALGGLRTTLLSRTAEGAARGLEKARGQIRVLEENGLADGERAGRAFEDLTASAEFDEVVRGADLVVESGPEKMDFKQDLFARMDALAPPGAVLATNTSGLSITAVAEQCAHPERVLTTHFWNPPHLMPLVEIVKGARTSEEAAQAVRALLVRCGKVPVLVKKDRPGQLGNRLQHALWREAVHIVAEGIADAGDVDLAAKTGFGLRLPVYGIFEHFDAVGVEVCTDIMHYIAQDLYNLPQAPDYLREMIRQGRLGASCGQGFYDWSKKDLRTVLERRDRFVLEFLRNHRPGE